MKTLWNGITVPEAGDGIPESWEKMAMGLGVGIPAASIAAARTKLTQAEAAGTAPTMTNPATFLIGEGIRRVQYVSDGSKTDGKWVLSPVNEVEADEVGAGNFKSTGGILTLGPNESWEITRANLPARPYDRVIVSWGMCDAWVPTGVMQLMILINGQDGQLARWERGNNENSASTQNMGIVKAGTDPVVILAVRSGTDATNTIQIPANQQMNKLMTLAFPITM